MNLIVVLSSWISDFFAVFCLAIFTKRRYSRRLTNASLALLYLMMFILEIFRYYMADRNNAWHFIMLISAVAAMIAGFALSEYHDSRTVFTVLMAASYRAFGNMLMKILFSLNIMPIAVIAVGLAVHIGLLHLLIHFLLPPYRRLQIVYRGEWRLLSLILVMYCSVMYLLYSCLDYPGVTMVQQMMPLVYLICAYFWVILAFQMLGRLDEREMKDGEQKIFQAGMEALKREVVEMHRAEEQIAEYNHDSRHFVRMLNGMLVEQDYQGVKRALAEIQDMPAVRGIEHYCGNLPLKGVVAYYVRLAEEHRVCASVELDELPENLGENSWELAMVVGNLMENAVQMATAVNAPQNRQLHLGGYENDGRIMIEIRNSFSGIIEFDRLTHLPVSVKGEEYGLGIKSVASFVKRWNGTLECGVDGECFFVRIRI